MRISTRIQSLLVSAALLVPLVATPVTAAYAQPTEEKTAASWSGVVINEAVELTKKYGADEDYQFVNGLLGTVAREQGLDTAEDAASEEP